MPNSPTGHDTTLESEIPEVPAKNAPTVYKEGYEPSPIPTRDSFGNPLGHPDPYAVIDSRRLPDQTPAPPQFADALDPHPTKLDHTTFSEGVNNGQGTYPTGGVMKGQSTFPAEGVIKGQSQTGKNIQPVVSMQAWAGIPGPDSMHSESSGTAESPPRELYQQVPQSQALSSPLHAPVTRAIGAVSYGAGTVTGVAAAVTVLWLMSIKSVLHSLSGLLASRLQTGESRQGLQSGGQVPLLPGNSLQSEKSWQDEVQAAVSGTANEVVELTQNAGRLTVQAGYWAVGVVAGVVSYVSPSAAARLRPREAQGVRY